MLQARQSIELMKMEIESRKSYSDKAFSLIQANNLFSTKILSRPSSVSTSSRFYHCATPGEIPFQWELKPGLPKDPPNSSYYVDPPPTSHTLPIPPARSPTRARVGFWKKLKIRRNHIRKKFQIGNISNTARVCNRDDRSSSVPNEFKPKNNNEYFTSSCASIFSSSSSSTTSSSSSIQSAKFQTIAKGIKKWVSL